MIFKQFHVLEHIAHFDINVGHAVIVAFVERHRPVHGKHKVVVHHQFQPQTTGKVRAVNVFAIVENDVIRQVVQIEFRVVLRNVFKNRILAQTIGLQNHSHIDKRIEADEEMLLPDVEFADLEAELHVGESVASGGDAVTQDAATGVPATKTFI